MEDCYICRKQRGEVEPPPGGYLLQDETWFVGHGPTEGAPAGTLIVESRRHVLDLEEMPAAEAASFGPLLTRLYPAIKRATGAPRVYLLATMAAVPHFHAWLVPWPADSMLRGIPYLAAEQGCSVGNAEKAAERIRAALGG